jgi:hypothetical protein
MGSGVAGSNATIALRGTVPLTSEVVTAGGVDDGAGEACGVLDPHAAVSAAAIIAIGIVVRMTAGW